MNVPRLTTDRLILRDFAENDFEQYAAMMTDPHVTRYLGDGKPLTRVDAWRQMAMLSGHWNLRGFGIWAVEERETARLAGRIGCFQPEGWPGFEIGYVLAPAFRGRGYATEGARAALRFAREILGRDRVISLIHPDNAASIRVAERLGAELGDTIEFFGRATHVYAYPLGA